MRNLGDIGSNTRGITVQETIKYDEINNGSLMCKKRNKYKEINKKKFVMKKNIRNWMRKKR